MTRDFTATWLANALIYMRIEAIAGTWAARVSLLGAVALTAWWLTRYRQQAAARQAAKPWFEPCDIILAIGFVFGPVMNPWYLLVMLPFCLHARSPFSICVLGIAVLGYATHDALGIDHPYPFTRPLSVEILQWGILVIGVLLSYRQHVQRRRHGLGTVTQARRNAVNTERH